MLKNFMEETVNYKIVLLLVLFFVSSSGTTDDGGNNLWGKLKGQANSVSSSITRAYDNSIEFSDKKILEIKKSMGKLIPALNDAGYDIDQLFIRLELGLPSAGMYITKVRTLNESQKLAFRKKYKNDLLIQTAMNVLRKGDDLAIGGYKARRARLAIFPLMNVTFYYDRDDALQKKS